VVAAPSTPRRATATSPKKPCENSSAATNPPASSWNAWPCPAPPATLLALHPCDPPRPAPPARPTACVPQSCSQSAPNKNRRQCHRAVVSECDACWPSEAVRQHQRYAAAARRQPVKRFDASCGHLGRGSISSAKASQKGTLGSNGPSLLL
jgi:hypothetical protein